VLSVRPKITDLNFHLFARNIHPELFEVCASRLIERENYSLKLKITTDGHAISFHHGSIILTEVSAGAHHSLPTGNILISHPIEGTTIDQAVYDGHIGFSSKVQLECVPAKMFVSIQQQLDQRVECEGLVQRFESNGRLAFGAISYINVQAYRKHVKVRTFHTFPETCSIIKSDTQFKLTPNQSLANT